METILETIMERIINETKAKALIRHCQHSYEGENLDHEKGVYCHYIGQIDLKNAPCLNCVFFDYIKDAKEEV